MEAVNQTYSAASEYWASFVDHYGEDESAETFLVVVGGFLVGFTTYIVCTYSPDEFSRFYFAPISKCLWLDGGLLLLVDLTKKPEWIINRRHQKSRPYQATTTSYNPSLLKLFKNVLFNWFFVILPGLYFLQKVCKPLGAGVYVSALMTYLSPATR